MVDVLLDEVSKKYRYRSREYRCLNHQKKRKQL